MVELLIAMPVIATFFVAVFYFGYGMNQRIENTMAVRHAAFVYGTDRGRDPDELQTPVTAADLRAQFMSRGRNIELTARDWSTPAVEWAAYVTDSFSGARRFFNGGWYYTLKWLPNNVVGLYLAGLGQPRGAEVTTRTRIDASELGYRIPFRIFNPPAKTVQATLYVDQKTRKLETASFNFDPNNPFDPGGWDFGALPIILTYAVGWDWDFASNCLSTLKALDTMWLLGPCPPRP
jgi:hypothetical protein